MPACAKKLPKMGAALEAVYGSPAALPTADPLELILWENIA